MLAARFAIACTVIASASALVSGSPPETEHLKVQLLSDSSSATPGRPLWVGLYFEVEKQWHIYWTNPGDSGEPPRVTWNLPDGFQAGEIQWPAPARLGSGSVVDYGYEEPVLLPIEVRPPAKARLGSTATLSAKVTWLVCRDICVPGKADLTLSLPVRATPSLPSAWHALFEATRSHTPRPMPAGWKANAVSEKDQFVLTIHGASATTALFFPLVEDQIDNAAPQEFNAVKGGMRLTLKKSDRLLKAPETLDGVLEVSSGRAYVVSAPVASPR